MWSELMPFFDAEPEPVGGGAGHGEPNQKTEPASDGAGDGAEIKLTKAELAKLLQQEGDKRVGEAQKKWEKKQADELRKIELEKMTEEQRKAAELKERDESLKEKELELTRKELNLETTRLLSEKDLPTDMLDLFSDVMDIEKRKILIGNLETAITKGVEARIKEMEKGTFVKTRSQDIDVSPYVRPSGKSIFDQAKEKLI